MDEEILHKNLSNYVTQNYIRTIEGYKYLVGLLLKKSKLTKEWLIASYYDFILNYDDYYMRIDQIINLIDDSYNNLPINYVIQNSLLREILFANGVGKIQDLKLLSADSLTLLFFINFEDILKPFAHLCGDFKTSYKDNIYTLFKSLKEKELDVLDKRNGFTTGEKMTLEEIGALYGVTRERCRQVEAAATNKLFQKTIEVKNILITLYLTLCTQEVRYISADKLYEFVSNELISRYILFLYSIAETDIVYDKDLNVLYNKNLTSLDEICDEILEIFGDILQVKEYEYLNDFEKAVVNHSFKKYRNCIYIKKGVTEKDLIGAVIDEEFPNGYKVGSLGDYTLLKSKFEQLYGSSEEFPSSIAIASLIERLCYCQVDKGTYINPKFCVVLPEEIITEIINFILDNPPTVFYSSIYEKFKFQLKKNRSKQLFLSKRTY